MKILIRKTYEEDDSGLEGDFSTEVYLDDGSGYVLTMAHGTQENRIDAEMNGMYATLNALNHEYTIITENVLGLPEDYLEFCV